MDLQSLLGDIPKQTFVAEYFHRLPFSLPQSARSVCHLGTWDVLAGILSRPDADVLVVRDGQRVPEPQPCDGPSARALADDGCTILVRHAERGHEGLQELGRAFEEDFLAPVNIHLYATPAGRHGFSWHYDAEDVFILQTSGRKEYSLRKNTVQPWPLEETLPRDMGYPSEIMPLLRVVLAAGDWLYIPCGYWHKAAALLPEERETHSSDAHHVPNRPSPSQRQDDSEPDTGTSISLALGVMSPAALDLFDFLRQRLPQSVLWRARLPVSGAASPHGEAELLAHYRELLRHLADDLARSMQSESFLQEFLAAQRESRVAKPSS